LTEASLSETRNGLGRGVVGLLALAIFINYVDRGNLATGAPLIKDELHLTNTQMGLLLSAFFWTYTPGQLVSGWLMEKINAYRMFALGLAIWSLATIATGFATGFWALFVLRLVLGLGESAAFPCSSKLFAEHLPPTRLGAANGWMAVGLALGPAFGAFVGGLIMARFGWRPAFIVFGLVSVLWLAPWHIATADASRGVSEAPVRFLEMPSLTAILARRELWGASLGAFAGVYTLYFVTSWLPLYLVKARGFSLSQMAELGGCVYLIYAISARLTGWLSDRWMRAGAGDTRVRKTFLIASNLGGAACMLGCAFGGPAFSIGALLLSGVFLGFYTTTVFATGQTLGGPVAAGRWIGVQNAISNTAGIVAPIVTGFVVDRTGQFALAFVVAAGVALAGVACWGLLVWRVTPIAWPKTA
jgi:MFS family permease